MLHMDLGVVFFLTASSTARPFLGVFMRSVLFVALLSGCSEYAVTQGSPTPSIRDLDVDVDVDGDGVPDLNIDTDDDGVPDLDIDWDGDGVPDTNVDIDGDGDPDIDIDIDEDGTPDVNIDLDDDDVPDINIDLNGDNDPDIDVDTDGDGEPDINIDEDGDDIPDVNLVDAFVVPEISDVDIVFYGDTSGSMDEELDAIGTRIAEFASRLDAEGGNWQLASINGDEGCAVDTLFTPQTADWAERFHEAILEEPDDEETDEMGLEIAARAVNQVGPGQCNEGLLRPNALLHVIILSDENDESDGWDSGDPTYWRHWVDQITAAKGGSQGLTRLSAITGETPDGCDGSDPGFGYVEAMQGTGGTFLSICDSWEEQLDLLAAASVVQDEFPLTVRPELSSVVVFVESSMRPSSDWVYNPVTNTVTIVVDPPNVGDDVRIVYDPQ